MVDLSDWKFHLLRNMIFAMAVQLFDILSCLYVDIYWKLLWIHLLMRAIIRAYLYFQVQRIQGFVEEMDILKERNSNPFGDYNNTMSVTTEWEKFDSGVGSLTAPTPMTPTKVTQEWEQFD